MNSRIDKIVAMIVEESLDRGGSDSVSKVYAVLMEVGLAICKVFGEERRIGGQYGKCAVAGG